MQNPEAENIQTSTTNVAPPRSHDAANATNAPNHPQDATDDQSPQSHSMPGATDSPPPTQMRASTPPSPPPQQSQMMMPPPPQPPFFQPSIPMLPHINPHFQLPPYLTYQPFPPFYGYPMMYPAGPGPNTYMVKSSWSTGLFDCFSDLKNCFITAFCPCVTFGQVSEILNEGHTPWWEGATTYFVVDVITATTGTFLCGWVYRAKMRKKHLSNGSGCMDLITSCCCTRLVLCQIYRQLDRLGYNVPLGWKANKERQGHRAMDNYRLQVVPPAIEPGMLR